MIKHTIHVENVKRRKFMIRILMIVLFVGVLVYSIGGTVHYFFYSDDYSVLYNIQRNQPLGFPYASEYYAVFLPLYHLFNTQPAGYFALGALSYALATLSVFLFIRVVTKNFFAAYFGSVLFATGYIGIEQHNMFVTSFPNNLSIIGICAALISYYFWIKKSQFRYYLLSLLLYFLFLYLFPFRVFTLILFIPTMDLFFRLNGRRLIQIKNIFISIACFLPFYFVGKLAGIFGYGDYTIHKLLPFFAPNMIAKFLAIFGRMIVPSPVLLKLGFEVNPQIHAAVGIAFFCVSSFLAIFLLSKRKHRNMGIYLLFALALTLEGYVGNFLLVPEFGDEGVASRYLPISFIGFSAFFAAIVWSVGIVFRIQKTLYYRLFFLCIFTLYVGAFSIVSHEYVAARVKDAGRPAAKFMLQLKKFIPTFPAHAAIYMDSSEFYPAIPRLGNILSYASYTYEVTYAVMYNVPMEGIRFTLSLDDYVKWHEQPAHPEEKFLAFYYDGIRLRDTTREIEHSLRSDEMRTIPIKTPTTVLNEQNKIIVVSTPRISGFGKQTLELTLRFSPIQSDYFIYPYYFDEPSETKKIEMKGFFENILQDRTNIFEYLQARNQYYHAVKVSGSLTHALYPHNFMVDNRLDTLWLDADNLWELRPQYKHDFVVDLGTEKQISRVLWIPANGREASAYKVSTSMDTALWKQVSVQTSKTKNGENFLVSDTFEPTHARYVKYEIDQTLNGWTPGISELEVVEDAYKSIDPLVAWRIGSSPFEYLKNYEETVQSYNYIRTNGVAAIYTKTDKEDILDNRNFVSLPIFVDGLSHTYRIPIPTRGTSLEEIGIKMAYPVHMEVEQMRVLQEKIL